MSDTSASASDPFALHNAAKEQLRQLMEPAGLWDAHGISSIENDRTRVFAIQDASLRKKIMIAYRACQTSHSEVRKSINDVGNLRQRIKNLPASRRNGTLVTASILAIAIIFLAHRFLGPPWDLAGAAISVLWGVSALHSVELRIKGELEALQKELADSQASDAEWAQEKPAFSDSEIRTGQMDATG